MVGVRLLNRHSLKILGIAIVVSALCIGSAVNLVTGMLPAALLSAIATVLFGIPILFSLWTSQRRLNRQDRQLKRIDSELSRVRSDVSTIAYRTQPIRDLVGTITRTRRDLTAMQRLIEDLRESMTANGTGGKDARDVVVDLDGLFSPRSVTAYTPAFLASENVAGRSAAARNDDPMTGAKYSALLREPTDGVDDRPVIALVASELGISDLETHCRVIPVRPESYETDLREEAAYLVIDDSAFTSGPWFGADSAEGTDLYLRLRQLIQTARRRHVLTVMLRHQAADHFTGELESLHHIVLGTGRKNQQVPSAVPSIVRILADGLSTKESNK